MSMPWVRLRTDDIENPFNSQFDASDRSLRLVDELSDMANHLARSLKGVPHGRIFISAP